MNQSASQSSTPRDDRPPAPDELHEDWPWFRPTLTFLFGALLATIVVGATNSANASGSASPTGPNSSSAVCAQVAADSQQLQQLADQLRTAAANHDDAGLRSAHDSLTSAERNLDNDLSDCQH